MEPPGQDDNPDRRRLAPGRRKVRLLARRLDPPSAAPPVNRRSRGSLLSTVYCLVLLAATVGAFVLAESVKTQLSPIYGTRIDKLFSPICRTSSCHKRAQIVFKLRRNARLAVWIDHNGTKVTTILSAQAHPRGTVRLAFSGEQRDGVRLPDGSYQPVVEVNGRTFALPNVIRLVTKPPQVVRVPHGLDTHISPDGDHRRDALSIHYQLNEPAHAILLIDDHRVEFTRRQARSGVLEWNGQIRFQLQPPGRYRIAVAAEDAAGNGSQPAKVGLVTIRYITLAKALVHARPGAWFILAVHADAKRLHWRFGRYSGTTSSHALRLRAPRKRGSYRAYITAVDHTARAVVIVSGARAR